LYNWSNLKCFLLHGLKCGTWSSQHCQDCFDVVAILSKLMLFACSRVSIMLCWISNYVLFAILPKMFVAEKFNNIGQFVQADVVYMFTCFHNGIFRLSPDLIYKCVAIILYVDDLVLCKIHDLVKALNLMVLMHIFWSVDWFKNKLFENCGFHGRRRYNDIVAFYADMFWC
jgi:hypothetical protein